jgi:hypothetical protein
MSLSRIILLVKNFPSLPASGDLLTPNVMRTVGSSTAIGICDVVVAVGSTHLIRKTVHSTSVLTHAQQQRYLI